MLTQETGSRKRLLPGQEEEADAEDGHHPPVKRWASPTTREDICMIPTPEKGSPKYTPQANQVSVITPRLPYVVPAAASPNGTPLISQHHLGTSDPQIMIHGDFSHIPSAFVHPTGNLVQRLHDLHNYELQQNKQYPLLIRKPAEHNAREPSAFVKWEDQRKCREQVINASEDRQPILTHTNADPSENVGKALPLKKRSVISAS